MLLIPTLLFITFFLLIYLWFLRNSEYWKKRNIPHPKPHIFFGNFKDALLMKKNLFQIYTDIYNDFQQFPYSGFFKVRVPGIIICDPKIINDILTKDFLSFDVNDLQIDEDLDPLAGKNPFFLTGQRWKTARSRLTHCFTSGKLKLMLPLMVKVTEDMVQYVENHITSGHATFDTKELSAKFTTDNVASCGFGLEAKSFSETADRFRQLGQMIFQPGWKQMIQILLATLFPSLTKLLKIKIVPPKADKYFRQIVKDTLKYREENKVIRNDFLDLVNQIRREDPSYTLEDMTSHALSFFVDGFETSSISLSFTIYELAANPLIQEKARQEVDEILSKHKNVMTYECVQEMTYLDCVISESLRLHPAGLALLKVSTKDYYLPAINGNKEDLLIKRDTPVALPVYGIHMNPKYFPNPELFDPDRFSEENKASIQKGTYLPFGDGPRVCLGQRFALLQIKVALVALLKNFEMRVNHKTREPLEIDEKSFMLAAKGGLWIDYYKRK